MKRGVVVTGLGVISAAGASPEETWRSLREGKGGLSPFSLLSSPKYEGVPSGQIGVEVADLGAAEGSFRSDQMALIAARQAVRESFPDADTDVLEEAGIILGASVGGMAQSELFLRRLLLEGVADTHLLRFHECASAAEAVADELGLGGLCETISTACSSGANAIGLAADRIASGETEIMLAGGIDSFSRLTLNGFGSLLLIDPQGCRPFDEYRKGISLGEGAALLVLESEEGARARNAPVLAKLAGWANTCDAHHATAPHPEGDGIVRAMRRALRDSHLRPEDIHYINAHGTATLDNDRSEASAISKVFGDQMPPVSSTKRFFGHTFAAAGAIEAVVCVLALKNNGIPPNAGLEQMDPQCPVRIQRNFQQADLSSVMSLSLGFGGNNNCFILTRGGV